MIDPGCQLCPRLADYRTSLQIQYPDYHCAPVADFGARDARLLIPPGGVLFTLGGIAHRMVIKALGLREIAYPFGHGNRYQLENDRQLFASYHPSRYNINTGRLTAEAFARVVHDIREVLP